MANQSSRLGAGVEAKMATVITVAAVTGFLLLFAATIALVILNWSERILAPTLSILLVGTATLLATVLVTLKNATIESAFTASVVLDTTNGVPPLVRLDPNNFKLTNRLSELAMLGQPATNVNGNTIITIQKPTTDDERVRFCAELLQYELLLSIEKLQRGSTSVGYLFGTSVAAVSKPMKLSDVVDQPGSSFLEVIASNRFSKSDNQNFYWKYGHFPLPRNTEVKLVHIATSPSTGTEKFIVRFEKPHFFTIDFIVEPLAGTGMGAMPPGLTVDQELASRCQTYHFQVTMRANFRSITAGNRRTPEYKDWANWLYSGVASSIGD